MTYDELYNKYKELKAFIVEDITITDIEKEVLANATLKPHQMFQKLNDIKEVLNNRKVHLENTLSLIDELIEAGQPVVPLKRNSCTLKTYKNRSHFCPNCVHACRMHMGDSDFIVCNFCNQAKKAKVVMYLNQDIIEAFKVSETGICCSYQESTNDTLQDITSYTQEDWVNENTKAEQPDQKNEGPEIPPEAEGHVDDYDNARTVFVVRTF